MNRHSIPSISFKPIIRTYIVLRPKYANLNNSKTTQPSFDFDTLKYPIYDIYNYIKPKPKVVARTLFCKRESSCYCIFKSSSINDSNILFIKSNTNTSFHMIDMISIIYNVRIHYIMYFCYNFTNIFLMLFLFEISNLLPSGYLINIAF